MSAVKYCRTNCYHQICCHVLKFKFFLLFLIIQLNHFMLFLHFHIVCAVTVCGANAEIKFTIPVGKLFTYELMRETFQNDFEPLSKLFGKSLKHSRSPAFHDQTNLRDKHIVH